MTLTDDVPPRTPPLTSPGCALNFLLHSSSKAKSSHSTPTHSHSPCNSSSEQNNVELKDQRSLPRPKPPQSPSDGLTWFESMLPLEPRTSSIKTIKLAAYLWNDLSLQSGGNSNLIGLGKTSTDREGWRHTTMQTELFWVLLLQPNIRNSCLNFPLWYVFYGFETRRKLTLKSLWRFLPFYAPAAKDNRTLVCKGPLALRAVQLHWGEEWDGPLSLQ